MQTEIVRIKLPEAEYAALVRLSEQELRSLANQARLAIREDLDRRGALKVAGNASA